MKNFSHLTLFERRKEKKRIFIVLNVLFLISFFFEVESCIKIYYYIQENFTKSFISNLYFTAYTSMVKQGPRPLVICGPSGSGKSTLLKKLFKEFPDTFGFR